MADELEDRLRRGLSEAASAHQPSLGADAAADALFRDARTRARRPRWERLSGAFSPGPARNRWLAGVVLAGAVAAVAALLVVRPSTTSLSTASRSARTSSGAAHSLSGAGAAASASSAGGSASGSAGGVAGVGSGASSSGGSTAGGSAGGAGSGSQSAPPVVVTQADQGRNITLKVGQTLEVRLSGGGSQRWSVPRSANAAVAQETTASANPTSGDASATFVARATGSTRVSSDARPICSAGQACPDFVRLWTIAVDVVG